MKRSIFTLILALGFSALFGQPDGLQHVIVMMADRYEDAQLSQKTALMTKEQRRDFVEERLPVALQLHFADAADGKELLAGVRHVGAHVAKRCV